MKNTGKYGVSRLVLVIFTIRESLAKGFKIHGIQLTKNRPPRLSMRRRINDGSRAAAAGVIFLVLSFTPPVFAAETSVLGGYVFNLQTKGYTTGTYQMNFIAANGALIYSVQFQVRQ